MWDIIGKIAVGFIVARIGFSVIKGLYGSFFASLFGFTTNFKKLGKWAVVTGATDGIGKAYAFQLAKQGLNLVLISRTRSKLQLVADEIKTKYGVETKIIDVDFTKATIYERIQAEISNLEIGVLINNVGMSYEHPEFFTKLSEETINDVIVCNILSVTLMTKIVLPNMLERRRGLIVNVSSYSSMISSPFLTVYGATKAYVTNFSKSLHAESSSKGVTVQCVMPGFVVSNMSKIRRPTLMAPNPMTYVSSSLKTTGIEQSTGGYYMHKLQAYFTEVAQQYLPGFILLNVVYGQLYAIRARALRKKEREAKQN